MLSKHFSKVRNLFRFTFLFGAVALLSYCTSSPKTASSFGKRKYTKGHFSDPVAKVKMEYKPYGEDRIATSTKAAKSIETENPAITKVSDKKKEIIGSYVAAAKKVETVVEKQAKSISQVIAKSPLGATANLSLKESSVSNAYPYVEHGYMNDHGGDDHKKSTYLLIWIIALVVALVCFLIGAAAFSITTSTAGCGTGCILLTISTLASIVAVIFFILWLVALSN